VDVVGTAPRVFFRRRRSDSSPERSGEVLFLPPRRPFARAVPALAGTAQRSVEPGRSWRECGIKSTRGHHLVIARTVPYNWYEIHTCCEGQIWPGKAPSYRR